MQKKTKLFLISVVVLVASFLLMEKTQAALNDWCCKPPAGDACNSITSPETCEGAGYAGYTLVTEACSAISTCSQYSGTPSDPGFEYPENTGLPTNDDLVKGIFTNVANFLLSIIGIIAIISFVISGIQYFLVATDEKMMETAKKTMVASIIGLVVALSGFIAIKTVEMLLAG